MKAPSHPAGPSAFARSLRRDRRQDAAHDHHAVEPRQRIEIGDVAAAQVGELTYRLIAEAWPIDTERMHWRMTYLTLEGERILVEDTAEFDYRHPAPGTLTAEAARVGLSLRRLDRTTFWLATRD